MHRGGIYKHLPVKDPVVRQCYQFIENGPAQFAPGTAIARRRDYWADARRTPTTEPTHDVK